MSGLKYRLARLEHVNGESLIHIVVRKRGETDEELQRRVDHDLAAGRMSPTATFVICDDQDLAAL